MAPRRIKKVICPICSVPYDAICQRRRSPFLSENVTSASSDQDDEKQRSSRSAHKKKISSQSSDYCSNKSRPHKSKPRGKPKPQSPVVVNEEAGGSVDVDRILLDSRDVERISVSCRTVRFGSYVMVPQDRIFISKNGLEITLPGSQTKNPQILRIMMKDIVKVLIHFGNSENSAAPTIFYYVNIHLCSRIKYFLNKMTDSKEEIFFDPASKDELHKTIILLPETITNEERLFLKSIYETGCLLEEITWEEAKDILVRAAPKEVQQPLKNPPKHNPTTSNSIQGILIYPPPPSKGRLTLYKCDMACLKEGQLLNDNIINFYLKYLYLNVLNDEEKKRTHIFDSFFYERLSKADCSHARIARWTKTLDIFEKDFIIIPINERHHWFLGIICFPGLTGPVRMSDNTPILPDNKQKDSSVLVGGQVPAKLAEAGDEDMEPNTTDEKSLHLDLVLQATPRSTKQKAIEEPIKQPCILIFDSLACESRANRAHETLRQYLSAEWKVQHKGQSRDFSKEVFKGAVPQVPQQTNNIDCGFYVLQYVDSFFKNPITDYHMPIKSIKQWFTTDEVNRKRFEIMQLILRFIREQKSSSTVDLGGDNL